MLWHVDRWLDQLYHGFFFFFWEGEDVIVLRFDSLGIF